MRCQGAMVLVAGLAIPVTSGAQAPAARAAIILTDYGGATADPGQELLHVWSVLRLPDGRFVVASGRSLQVRVHGRTGIPGVALGREGAGPGEYRSSSTCVHPWPGDSVVIYSAGTRQWLLYALDGTFARQWAATSEEQHLGAGWSLAGSAIVRHGILGRAGCSVDLLRRLAPAQAASLSEAMTDHLGRVWLRRLGTTRWNVHGANGDLIARLDLPRGFHARQFDGDLVVGTREDDDGFPHVTVIRHGLPEVGRVASPDCAWTVSGIDPVRVAHFKTAMRNAMTFAEAYYADHGRYPGRADEYPRGLKVPDADFRVMGGDGDSYAVSILDRATGFRCLVNVGSRNDMDGVLLCGR